MEAKRIDGYLRRKGWQFEATGGRFVVETCPLCGEGKLTIDPRVQAYHCTECGKEQDSDGRGAIAKLLRMVGDLDEVVRKHGDEAEHQRPEKVVVESQHRALLAAEEFRAALGYLTAHGISEKTIKALRIGAAKRGEEVQVAIPVFDAKGPVNVRYVPVGGAGGKAATQPKCGPYVYQPGGMVEGQAVLVGSELDAVALYEMGIRNVVVPWRVDPKEPALDRLAGHKEIVLLGLDDAQALALATKLGAYRCRIVSMELSPLQLLAAGYTAERVHTAIREGKAIHEHRIARAGEYKARMIERLRNKDTLRGQTTGWAPLDEVFGGWRGGELSIVTGNTGSGKTTWTKSVVLQLARAGQPCAVASLENGPPSVIEKMLMEITGKKFASLTMDELDAAYAELDRLPLYFVDIHGEVDFDTLTEIVHLVIAKYGVFMVVLDNLQFFLRAKPDEERYETERIVKTLKGITRTTGVHVILIAHPHKVKDHNPVIGPNDLKGSGDLDKLIDNGITVWRRRVTDTGGKAAAESFLPDTVTLIYCWKVRADAGQEGRCVLDFSRDASSYSVLDVERLRKQARRKSKTVADGLEADPLEAIPAAQRELFPAGGRGEQED